MLLINYEINPILTLSEDCILISVGTLPCLIVGGGGGGGVKLHILGEKPSSSFNYYNYYLNLDNFSPGAFYSTPSLYN